MFFLVPVTGKTTTTTPGEGVATTTTEVSKCNVATSARVDCALEFEGILSREICESELKCCWDESWRAGNNSGCFYDNGE